MADTGEDREIRQRANAHEAEVVRGLSDFRQVGGNLNAGDRRCDRLGFAAVGMARFRIERLELAWSAAHP